ncbi:MAG: 1-acyl-sn-glycerol-3-phosphate acyltransferase [Oscillospiraceae bacterium]|nr:1-acyl-sn-glycerol-3-phosphate acyltransferase [Oscillospiraceae bacterium]
MRSEDFFDFTQFNNYKMMNVIRPLGNLFCKTYYKVEYAGLENLDRKGGFIIAPNHVTEFDPLFIAMASKRLYHYIAKYELFTNPVLNKAITHLNAFPIVRGRGDMTAINYAIELIRRGEVLCIFPEGTRSPDGSPKTAKSGVGLMARKTGADVIPAAIYMENKDKKGSRVVVKFGEAIKNEEMGFTDTGKSKENKAAANKIMDEITRLWESCK